MEITYSCKLLIPPLFVNAKKECVRGGAHRSAKPSDGCRPPDGKKHSPFEIFVFVINCRQKRLNNGKHA